MGNPQGRAGTDGAYAEEDKPLVYVMLDKDLHVVHHDIANSGDQDPKLKLRKIVNNGSDQLTNVPESTMVAKGCHLQAAHVDINGTRVVYLFYVSTTKNIGYQRYMQGGWTGFTPLYGITAPKAESPFTVLQMSEEFHVACWETEKVVHSVTLPIRIN